MRNDGVVILDERIVRQLIDEQFPQWSALSLTRMSSWGTDNAVFRLGQDLLVRLPLFSTTEALVTRETRWLPRLAPHLPLLIPTPVAVGVGGGTFPRSWAVYAWLRGQDALAAPPDDMTRAAADLGSFVRSMGGIDATRGPASPRGGRALSLSDEDARAAVADLAAAGELDGHLAAAFCAEVMSLPPWVGEPRWLHGDLTPGNLLTLDGRVHAVIDFGLCGLGDPACDLMAAWTVFDRSSREHFRAASTADDLSWARGRGWAFSFGLRAWHHHVETNPVLASVGRRAVEQVLSEFQAM